jgi:hypothetical protein
VPAVTPAPVSCIPRYITLPVAIVATVRTVPAKTPPLLIEAVNVAVFDAMVTELEYSVVLNLMA